MGFLQGINTLKQLAMAALLLSVMAVQAQDNKRNATDHSKGEKRDKKTKRHSFRILAGPALSFYQNNQFHTNDSKPRYAFFGGIYDDIRILRDFSFMPGLEYTRHGLTFNSYYLVPGQLNLYDGHFNYNYRLTLQEARLNLLLKQTIGIESRNIVTGYTSCGYILRYLIKTDMHVSSNLSGQDLFNGTPNISFEHDVIRKNMASAVKFAAGAQRNYFKNHRAIVFECAFVLSLSRFYIKENFTPSNLYINGSFMQLGLGFKL